MILSLYGRMTEDGAGRKFFYTSDTPFGSLQERAKKLYDEIEWLEFDAKLSPKVHQMINNYVKGGRPE